MTRTKQIGGGQLGNVNNNTEQKQTEQIESKEVNTIMSSIDDLCEWCHESIESPIIPQIHENHNFCCGHHKDLWITKTDKQNKKRKREEEYTRKKAYDKENVPVGWKRHMTAWTHKRRIDAKLKGDNTIGEILLLSHIQCRANDKITYQPFCGRCTGRIDHYNESHYLVAKRVSKDEQAVRGDDCVTNIVHYCYHCTKSLVDFTPDDPYSTRSRWIVAEFI